MWTCTYVHMYLYTSRVSPCHSKHQNVFLKVGWSMLIAYMYLLLLWGGTGLLLPFGSEFPPADFEGSSLHTVCLSLQLLWLVRKGGPSCGFHLNS